MKEFYSDAEMRTIGYHLAQFLASEMGIDGAIPKSLVDLRVTLEKTMINPNTQYECHLSFQTKNRTASFAEIEPKKR